MNRSQKLSGSGGQAKPIASAEVELRSRPLSLSSQSLDRQAPQAKEASSASVTEDQSIPQAAQKRAFTVDKDDSPAHSTASNMRNIALMTSPYSPSERSNYPDSTRDENIEPEPANHNDALKCVGDLFPHQTGGDEAAEEIDISEPASRRNSA